MGSRIGCAFTLMVACGAVAQDAPVPATKSAQRDRLEADGMRLVAAGRLDEAAAAFEKSMALEREVSGRVHRRVAAALLRLVELHQARHDWTAARSACREMIAVEAELYGKDDWRTADSRLALQHVEVLAGLSAEKLADLRTADAALADAGGRFGRGDTTGAVAAVVRAVELRRKNLPRANASVARNLFNLGMLHRQLGDDAKAEPAIREALAVFVEVLPAGHPDIGSGSHELGVLSLNAGRLPEAEKLLAAAVELRRRVLPEAHPDRTQSLDALAASYFRGNNFAGAEPLVRESLQLRRKSLPVGHPRLAASLKNLSGLLRTTGRHAEALALHRDELKRLREAFPPQHEKLVPGLIGTAALHGDLGEFAEAQPLLREALDMLRKCRPATHPELADCLHDFGTLHQLAGDGARAEALLTEALRIRREIRPRDDLPVASTLERLGILASTSGRSVEAEAMLSEALGIRRKVLPVGHPDIASVLFALGDLAWSTPDKANALFRESLEIRRKAHPAGHPSIALPLSRLAGLALLRGDPTAAEPMLTEALRMLRTALPVGHPDICKCLKMLGDLHLIRGDRAAADKCFRESLEDARTHLDLSAAALADRQQLLMTEVGRPSLEGFLNAAIELGADPGEVHARVLPWKGAVLARRQSLRAAALHDPGLTARLDELRDVSARMAALASAEAGVDPELRRGRWRELTERRERLEVELSQRSDRYRVESARPSPEKIAAALAADAALVDLYEYRHLTVDAARRPSWQRRLVAFVLRRDRPAAMVALGEAAVVDEAVARWRGGFGGGDGAATGAEIRRRVWDPLLPHIAGAASVLVSPDGALCRFPWAALPGRDPSKFLIEEGVAVTLVAIPRMLMSSAREPDGSPPSLLLLGNADFDAEPAARGSAGDGNGANIRWPALPGTRDEVRSIAEGFAKSVASSKPMLLEGADATKAAFVAAAPRFRMLHLATHGFFAGAGEGTAGTDAFGIGASGRHPGLLSGIVFAGANVTGADAVLTATEAAELDLRRADLVVLGACETGLGAGAGGEGVVGLQRALQAAGARAAVTSLWKVDDAATRHFMVRFHANLRGADGRQPMPASSALRETQLWMLREGIASGSVKRGETVPHPTRDSRGWEPRRLPEFGRGRCSPYYWAAFVLSGDGR